MLFSCFYRIENWDIPFKRYDLIILFRKLFLDVWGLLLTTARVLRLRQDQWASVPGGISWWWCWSGYGDHFQRGGTTRIKKNYIGDLLLDWSAKTGLHELFDQQRECNSDSEKERQGKITGLQLDVDKREMLSVSAKSCWYHTGQTGQGTDPHRGYSTHFGPEHSAFKKVNISLYLLTNDQYCQETWNYWEQSAVSVPTLPPDSYLQRQAVQDGKLLCRIKPTIESLFTRRQIWLR